MGNTTATTHSPCSLYIRPFPLYVCSFSWQMSNCPGISSSLGSPSSLASLSQLNAASRTFLAWTLSLSHVPWFFWNLGTSFPYHIFLPCMFHAKKNAIKMDGTAKFYHQLSVIGVLKVIEGGSLPNTTRLRLRNDILICSEKD